MKTIIDKYRDRERKELLRLIKKRGKKERKIEKEMKKRLNNKYTTKYLKENKKHLTKNAITIDKEEYEQIAMYIKRIIK